MTTFSLLLLGLILSFLPAAFGQHENGYYDRLLVLGGTSLIPPNISTIARVVDPDHARMRSMGVFSNNTIEKMDADAFQYFITMCGLDFTTTPPVGPFHSRTISINNGTQSVTLLETDVGGADYRVLYDSENPARGRNAKWYMHSFHDICNFNTNVTCPGGVLAGKNFSAGSTFSYGFDLMLKNGSNWMNSNWEVMVARMDKPRPTLSSDLGPGEFFSTLSVTMGDGTECLSVHSVHLKLVGGALATSKRNVITCPDTAV